MPKIAINIVRYNHPLALLRDCISAALAQDIDDYNVMLTENGSADSIESEILALFGENPRFRYHDNKKNLGFAGAHNVFFSESDSELVMPLNPDTVMASNYLSELTGAFSDLTIAAATGKMLKCVPPVGASSVLDGTGIMMSRGRRGCERGQNQIDAGQFDDFQRVFGVSGTASLYRKSALNKVLIFGREYFDEDFFAYWEDLDLSWRLRLVGYNFAYVPDAVIYHSRAVGQSKNGYRSPVEFIKHHRQFPVNILRWNWRNQLFCIIKNDFGWSFWRDIPFIVIRQVAMLGYIVVFEPRTLGVLPEFFRLLPRMLKKRRAIRDRRVVSSREIGKWFHKK